jgi:hypothetical protein
MSDEAKKYVGADLSNQDLRHTDFTNKILFGTNLRGSELYGAAISLKCDTFDGAKFDPSQVATLLLMISLADIDPKFQVGLRDLVRRVTGEKHFAALQRYLQVA